MPPIKLSAQPPATLPDVDHPRPERRLHGHPRRETWNVASPAGAEARMDAGLWRCEPGHWRIALDPGCTELFTVLAGRCRVHDEAGGVEEVGPGEALVLPAGFRGSFEVLETVTKTYAVFSAASPLA